MTAPSLALLLAAPQPGETAMYRDQAAMAEALLARGFAADDILCLHGRLDRPLVLAALQAVSRRVAGWTAGSLFVHVSGHGFFTGDTLETARPGSASNTVTCQDANSGEVIVQVAQPANADLRIVITAQVWKSGPGAAPSVNVDLIDIGLEPR